jgi:hypothetical protein
MPGAQTFRQHVWTALAGRPLIALGLDLALNRHVDVRLSAWDEFFLPHQVRDHLLTVAVSRGGEAESLLAAPAYLLVSPARSASFLSGYQWAILLLAPIAAAALIGALWIRAFGGSAPAQGAQWSIRLIGAATAMVGLAAAAVGTLTAALWAGSGQRAFHHNANLWVFWPVDWVLAAYGLTLLVTGKRWTSARPRGRLVLWLAQAHLAAMVLFLVLSAVGAIAQDVRRVIVYLVPVTAMTYVAISLGGVSSAPEVARGRAVRTKPDRPGLAV